MPHAMQEFNVLRNNNWNLLEQFEMEGLDKNNINFNRFISYQFDMEYFEGKLFISGPFKRVNQILDYPFVITIQNNVISRVTPYLKLDDNNSFDSFSTFIEPFGDSLMFGINIDFDFSDYYLAKYSKNQLFDLTSKLTLPNKSIRLIKSIVHHDSAVFISVNRVHQNGNYSYTESGICYYLKSTGELKWVDYDYFPDTRLFKLDKTDRLRIFSRNEIGYVEGFKTIKVTHDEQNPNSSITDYRWIVFNKYNDKYIFFNNNFRNGFSNYTFTGYNDTNLNYFYSNNFFPKDPLFNAEANFFKRSNGDLIIYSNFIKHGYLNINHIGSFNPSALSVSGSVFVDININCLNDNSDEPLKHRIVRDINTEVAVVTQENGSYSFIVNSGDDLSIEFMNLENETINCFSGLRKNYTNITNSFSGVDENFPITVSEDLVLYYVIPSLRKGLENNSWLIYNSNGLNSYYNKEIVLEKIDGLTYSNFSLQPIIENDSQIIWNIDTIKSTILNKVYDNKIRITITPDPNIYSIGDSLIHKSYFRQNFDAFKINDTAISKNFIIGPYDPNDKTPNPSGIIARNIKSLSYLIRFQNTGNAPARNVVITDTLDPKVKTYGLRILGVSHPETFNFRIEGNVIIFSFLGIELPDSNSDLLGSQGFVSYELNKFSTLEIGDTIFNSANIYFDFEDPIITNRAQSPVYIEKLSISKNDKTILNIYPNPNNGVFRIEELKASEKIWVYDITGKVIKNNTASGLGDVEIDLSGYSKGVYLIRSENGSSGRVIIQ